MRDKDKIPNITNENEKKYWLEFYNTQSPYIREVLINKYFPLLKYAADRIYVNMDSHENIEFQDLVGFGSFGLIDAINKYDPNIDINFQTYVLDKISRAIYDGLGEMDYPSASISGIWYVDDDYDEISVIDTLKPKTNQKYFSNREYAKNKIVSDLKKLP